MTLVFLAYVVLSLLGGATLVLLGLDLQAAAFISLLGSAALLFVVVFILGLCKAARVGDEMFGLDLEYREEGDNYGK
jgi:hypothetical protein